MTEQQYNTDLLMQVREKIVNEPEKHHQGEWAVAQSDPSKGGDCGTAYCVAGWATVLDGQSLEWADAGDGEWDASHTTAGEPIWGYAQAALGLADQERGRLFRGSNERFVVLDMLDRLIEAGKNGVRVPEGEL